MMNHMSHVITSPFLSHFATFACIKHKVSPQGSKSIRLQFGQHFPQWKMPNIHIFFPRSLQKDVQGRRINTTCPQKRGKYIDKAQRKNPVSLEEASGNVIELNQQSQEMRDSIYYRLVLSLFTSFFCGYQSTVPNSNSRYISFLPNHLGIITVPLSRRGNSPLNNGEQQQHTKSDSDVLHLFLVLPITWEFFNSLCRGQAHKAASIRISVSHDPSVLPELLGTWTMLMSWDGRKEILNIQLRNEWIWLLVLKQLDYAIAQSKGNTWWRLHIFLFASLLYLAYEYCNQQILTHSGRLSFV